MQKTIYCLALLALAFSRINADDSISRFLSTKAIIDHIEYGIDDKIKGATLNFNIPTSGVINGISPLIINEDGLELYFAGGFSFHNLSGYSNLNLNLSLKAKYPLGNTDLSVLLGYGFGSTTISVDDTESIISDAKKTINVSKLNSMIGAIRWNGYTFKNISTFGLSNLSLSYLSNSFENEFMDYSALNADFDFFNGQDITNDIYHASLEYQFKILEYMRKNRRPYPMFIRAGLSFFYLTPNMMTPGYLTDFNTNSLGGGGQLDFGVKPPSANDTEGEAYFSITYDFHSYYSHSYGIIFKTDVSINNENNSYVTMRVGYVYKPYRENILYDQEMVNGTIIGISYTLYPNDTKRE